LEQIVLYLEMKGKKKTNDCERISFGTERRMTRSERE
jgi:hypothetical protein